MTEAEWLGCLDPSPMLDYLQGWATERKLRLFALSCCLRVSHLLTDKSSRQALDWAERDAEGGPAGEDPIATHRGPRVGDDLLSWTNRAGVVRRLLRGLTHPSAWSAAWVTSLAAANALAMSAVGVESWSPTDRNLELEARASEIV